MADLFSYKCIACGGDVRFNPATGDYKCEYCGSRFTEADLENGGLDIVSLLVKTGLVSTRGDGRRNVEQGGVSVNDEKVTDFKKVFTADELKEGIIIKKGKKGFNRVTLA